MKKYLKYFAVVAAAALIVVLLAIPVFPWADAGIYTLKVGWLTIPVRYIAGPPSMCTSDWIFWTYGVPFPFFRFQGSSMCPRLIFNPITFLINIGWVLAIWPLSVMAIRKLKTSK